MLTKFHKEQGNLPDLLTAYHAKYADLQKAISGTTFSTFEDGLRQGSMGYAAASNDDMTAGLMMQHTAHLFWVIWSELELHGGEWEDWLSCDEVACIRNELKCNGIDIHCILDQLPGVPDCYYHA